MVVNPHSQQQHMVHRSTGKQPLEGPKLSIVEIWTLLLSRLKDGTDLIKERFERRAKIEKEINARHDDWCKSIFTQNLMRLEQLTAELEMQLAITKNMTQGEGSPQTDAAALAQFTLTPWQMEERFRALIQIQSFVGSFFERASPGYDQSRTLWWFDPAYHRAKGLNYDRYGATDVANFEERLLKSLGMGDHDGANRPLKLLLTSSGVSAFTCLNQFVMSKLVKSGDTIVLSPYLYFENFDHLRPLGHVTVVNSKTFDAEDIIETAERHNARVVYLDPMANTLGLETTDLRKMAQLIAGRPGWSDRFLLMDGTLISGGLPLYDWFNEPSHPKILYFESAHKYIQMGMDIVMCGLMIYPEELHQDLGLIRQITGTTLYSRQANVVPPVDSQVYQSRMYWLTSNAERLYHILDKQASHLAEFNYPLHWRKMGWGHGGNVVTIKLFGDDQANKRPALDRFIEAVLRAAEEEDDVGMTKGGGLGFSATRIWPSTPFIRDEDPYIRISVGIDPDEVEGTARAIMKALDRHCRASRSVMAQWRLRENGGVTPHNNANLGNGNGYANGVASGNGVVNGNGGMPLVKASAHFGQLLA